MIATWFPPELPQLKSLLDPVTFGRILATGQVAVGEATGQVASGEATGQVAGGEATGCRLERVRYRPGRNCLLTWRVDVATKNGAVERRFVLMVCRDGASAGVYDAARAAGGEESVQHLAEFDAVLWAFPDERKLRGIRQLAAPERLLAALTEVISPRPVRPLRPLTIVQYVAERSCTVRLPLDDESVGYGKFYRPGESAPAWQTVTELWQSAACREGRLVIPEPLAWHAESESVWLRELGGVPLERVAIEQQLSQFKRIGQTLAILHQTPLESNSTRDQLRPADLTVIIPVLTTIRPSLGARLERLATMLIESAPEAAIDDATLHGDLHLKNIFSLPAGQTGQVGQIGLLDLDNLGVGDPLLDLGSLAGYLHYRGMAAALPVEQVEWEIAQLCEGYETEAGRRIDHAALRHHIATALITERAWRGVTRLKPNGPADIERLLDLAERTLGRR
jgi:hypothetical protein